MDCNLLVSLHLGLLIAGFSILLLLSSSARFSAASCPRSLSASIAGGGVGDTPRWLRADLTLRLTGGGLSSMRATLLFFLLGGFLLLDFWVLVWLTYTFSIGMIAVQLCESYSAEDENVLEHFKHFYKINKCDLFYKMNSCDYDIEGE